MPRATRPRSGETGSRKRPVSPSTALARPGDPLVLGDGSVIASNRAAPAPFALKEAIEPSTFRPVQRRTLKELPAGPGVLNAIAAVFMYTMLGLTDREIADTLHISTDEVQQVRQHAAYSECFETVLGEFVNANSDLLQSRIAAATHDAFSSVHALATTSRKEDVMLRASQDILDRGGARPQDNMSRKQVSSSALRIEIIDNERQVNIEINPDV